MIEFNVTSKFKCDSLNGTDCKNARCSTTHTHICCYYCDHEKKHRGACGGGCPTAKRGGTNITLERVGDDHA